MRAQGLRATLVTRDKDLAQLITPGDVYWDYTGDIRYHHGEIEDRFGVPPDRYADYLALTGDAVDNIPGVPGVGPKTATVLMQHFATLEDLYERARCGARPAAARRGAARCERLRSIARPRSSRASSRASAATCRCRDARVRCGGAAPDPAAHRVPSATGRASARCCAGRRLRRLTV